MSKSASKFVKNWLEAKPYAIIQYVKGSSSYAISLKASKNKMIQNFNSSMMTDKFEKGLDPYVNNELMGNAYRDGMNAKRSFTKHELDKVAYFIDYQQRNMIGALELLYEDSLKSSHFFAYPRYTNNPKRYRMECMMGLNKISLSRWYFGKNYVEIPLLWDDYMVSELNWIPAFDI